MRRQQGFAHAVLIIGLMVALIGALGFIFWQNFIHKEPKQSDQQIVAIDSTKKNKTETDVEKSKTKIYKMKGVNFSIPSEWTNDEKAIRPSRGMNRVDVAAFLPGEKLPTIYGSGTEHFHVDVAVYMKAKEVSSKKWFEMDGGSGTVGGEGSLMAGSTESDKSIHGYDSYFRNVRGDYEEVHYVLSSGDRVIHISARTLETNPKTPGVGDFRKFESAIKAIAESVRFN